MSTVVDHRTGEIVDAPSYADVRESIDTAKASLEAAAEQIVWQIENRVWLVLGHADWNTMREQEYGGAAFMVPRAERPELVARMRRAGLTQQEIADTAGVAEATVRNDLNRTFADEEAPPITNARGQQRPASYTRTPEPAQQSTWDRANTDPNFAHPEDEWLPRDDALSEFPDLAYYANTGRESDVALMAQDLRRFRDRGELEERLDILRRSIAVDKAKRDGTYRPGTTAAPDGSGGYRMGPLPAPAAPTTRTCPTCSGRGLIEE